MLLLAFKVAMNVTSLYFMVLIFYFIASKTMRDSLKGGGSDISPKMEYKSIQGDKKLSYLVVYTTWGETKGDLKTKKIMWCTGSKRLFLTHLIIYDTMRTHAYHNKNTVNFYIMFPTIMTSMKPCVAA